MLYLIISNSLHRFALSLMIINHEIEKPGLEVIKKSYSTELEIYHAHKC